LRVVVGAVVVSHPNGKGAVRMGHPGQKGGIPGGLAEIGELVCAPDD